MLPNTYLYACGELTESDTFDAGSIRPFPPPLPPSYNCRNVAPPVFDAGPTEEGALWCCNTPPACVRALALDATCKSVGTPLSAYSCPMGVFPAASNDGGLCTAAGLADAGITLTPPQAASEVFLCCPGT